MKKPLLALIAAIALPLFSKAQLFESFFPGPTNDLFTNDIGQLAFDNANHLFCSTRGDSLLVKFDNGNWSYFGSNTYGFAQSGSSLEELAIDPTNNNVYLGHFSTFDQFDGSTTMNFNTSNSALLNDYIVGIAINDNGDKLIGLGNGFGLAHITSTSWTNKGDFTGAFSELNNIFTPKIVRVDPNTGDFWIIYSNTIYQMTATGVIVHNGANFPSSLSYVTDMTTTSNGDIWFSLNNSDPNNGGFLKYDGTSWSRITTDNSAISSNQIYTIDGFGNHILFTSNISGIHHYFSGTFETFDASNSNYGSTITTSVREILSNDTEVFIATGYGLVKMTPPFTSEIQEELLTVKVFPNPCATILSVECETPIHKIHLTSLDGKLIPVVLNENQIDVSNIPSGHYICAFELDGAVVREPIIIKH